MRFTVLTILLILSFRVLTQAQSIAPQYPIIADYGGIYAIPEAQKYPDTTLTYRIVIEIVQGADEISQLNPALNNIARMLNLHGLGGVSPEQLEVVGVVHGAATPVVLENEAFREKYGADNPNDELIRVLSEAGVKIFVCGQSLLARNFYPQPLHPEVTVSISALTILTEYQRKGYAFLKF